MTPEILALCTGSALANAQRFASYLTAAMDEYGIDTPERQAAFLANVAVESGSLRYTTELWGPTDAQARYEGRADLGNFMPGDGKRFRGHGLIQTTGRKNHSRVGLALGLDLEQNPELLAEPENAARSAAFFWHDSNINQYADAGDFDACCDMVNRGHHTERIGDTNGYTERVRFWGLAKAALGIA
jgi:putative chitinase